MLPVLFKYKNLINYTAIQYAIRKKKTGFGLDDAAQLWANVSILAHLTSAPPSLGVLC